MPQNDLLVAAAREAAIRNGIDPDLFIRIIQIESNFDPNARSAKGALGLGQLMSDTAREVGVKDPLDPLDNLNGSARYYKQLLRRFGDDPVLASAAYNSGPGSVEQYGGIPPFPETREYVSKLFGAGEVSMKTSPEALAALGTPVQRSPLGPPQQLGSLAAAQAEFNRLFHTPPEQLRDISEIPPGEHGVTPEMIASHLGIALPESPGTRQAFIDTVTELIADELEPLNLALLIGSIGAGSFAFKTTARLMGSPIVRGAAAETASNIFVRGGRAVIGKRSFFPRAAEGAAYSIGFSLAELFEEPEDPGSSRVGEFASAFALNEAFDIIALSVGIPISFIGRMRREVLRTFQLSMDSGAGFGRAAADAMVSRVEMLRSAGVPDEVVAQIMEASVKSVSETTPELLSRLRASHGDRLWLRARELGLRGPKGEVLTRETFDSGLSEMFDDLSRAALDDKIQKEAARLVESQAEIMRIGETSLRAFRDTPERRAARLDIGFGDFADDLPQSLPELLEKPVLLDAVRKDLELIETLPGFPFPPEIEAAITRLSILGYGRINLRNLRLSSTEALRKAAGSFARRLRRPPDAAKAVAEPPGTPVQKLQRSLYATFPTSGERDEIDIAVENTRRLFEDQAIAGEIIAEARKGIKPSFSGPLEGIRVLRDLLNKSDFAQIELSMVVEGARSAGVPEKKIRDILKEFGRRMPPRPPKPGAPLTIPELEEALREPPEGELP